MIYDNTRLQILFHFKTNSQLGASKYRAQLIIIVDFPFYQPIN